MLVTLVQLDLPETMPEWQADLNGSGADGKLNLPYGTKAMSFTDYKQAEKSASSIQSSLNGNNFKH